jgi:hypothetical protein
MRGATVAEEQQHQQPNEQSTTDFEVLDADLSRKGSPRKAPNPLRSANPAELKEARADIRRIVAARRAGLTPPEG